MWFVWGMAAVAAPSSTQKAFEIDRGAVEWTFRYTWQDAGEGRQKVTFDLPAADIGEDKEELTWLPRHQMMEDVAKQVRRWGKDLRRVDLTVRVDGPTLFISAKGTGDVRGALKEAEDVRDRAIDAWLAEHRFTRLRDDALSFDHAALVVDYTDDLRPVAEALRVDAPNDRAYVERALSFVQSLPYEARLRSGGDPGYRRPLALLARNRGDCDSKAVLFLALVHAELPDVPLAVIYVPEHALVGVGLPEADGDRTFKEDGVRYVYAEPVGPAQFPLGETAPENRRAGKKGEVRPVP